MEAFFRKDQEIQELIDLFIEKLLTVNILSGSDADSEFYRGRQAVEKIALLFKEMAELPDEALIDGIRQLVEQRLPDSRVIENFPNFYELMNDMIQAGLPNSIAIPALAKPGISTQLGSEQIITSISSSGRSSLTPSSKITLNGGRSLISDTQNPVAPISLRQHISSQPPESVSNTELFQELKSELDISNDSIFESVPDSNIEDQVNQSTIATEVFADHLEITQDMQIDFDVRIDSEIEKVSDIENSSIIDIQSSTETLSELQTFDKTNTLEKETSHESVLDTKNNVPMIVESLSGEELTPIKLEKNNDLDITLDTVHLVLNETKDEVKTEIDLVSEQEEIKFKPNDELKLELETGISKVVLEDKKPKEKPPQRDPYRFNSRKSLSHEQDLKTTSMPQKVNSDKEIQVFGSSISPPAPLKKQEKTQMSRVVRTSQMPADGDRLEMVLKRIFPNSQIHWNVSIGKNTFYAQVDKLLIYVLETEFELDTRHIEMITASMRKQGWSVYVCLKEDLVYPRRIERGIRLAIR